MGCGTGAHRVPGEGLASQGVSTLTEGPNFRLHAFIIHEHDTQPTLMGEGERG